MRDVAAVLVGGIFGRDGLGIDRHHAAPLGRQKHNQFLARRAWLCAGIGAHGASTFCSSAGVYAIVRNLSFGYRFRPSRMLR